MADWRDQKYIEVFDGTLNGLQRRRAVDPAFSIEDVENQLVHLYVLDGNDWLGRGVLGDIVSEATIAAYELFIEEWKIEKGGKNGC
ncbi:MAG TPA: hypothetical protein PLX63_09545 [Rectinema sp.]|jgi:hypothetical protein|nr:hypothetical protein [Rectinema sp.]HOR49050.1 hypothetical protein [Rectinema sp.]HPB62152.1 hypothetical protein [Rectinema sp.]HPL71796.1 hypothetical protein [Rectinema sp.]HQK10272.1 hypothetical protein [Rectinema sp.]